MNDDETGREPAFTIEPKGDIEEAVRADTTAGLDEWFEPNPDGFRLRTDLHTHGAIASGPVTAVAWRYEATARPAVWGVSGGRSVEVHGATFVDASESDGAGDARFSRYIDWHGVFGQLGVAAAGRIVDERDD